MSAFIKRKIPNLYVSSAVHNIVEFKSLIFLFKIYNDNIPIVIRLVASQSFIWELRVQILLSMTFFISLQITLEIYLLQLATKRFKTTANKIPIIFKTVKIVSLYSTVTRFMSD